MSMSKVISAVKKADYSIPDVLYNSLSDCQEYIEDSILAPSGLSCIKHAYCIIKILHYLNADIDTLNAALLYSMVEYGDLPTDGLENLPQSVFDLVEGIQTMSVLHQVYSASSLGDNLSATDAMRRMMLAMVHDGRTVFVKLVEQVVILLHVKNKSNIVQDRLANETIMIYAPLANRLGLSELKWQLEDLAFRVVEPDVYNTLSKGISLNRIHRDELVAKIVLELRNLLEQHDVEIIECYGRAKHLYSLYRKMQRKNLTLQGIYDAVAIRVIVKDIDACYVALSAIHEKWQVILHEFDDYIAKPKPNGYRSIHTAVLYEESPVEIQIRTESMNAAAEVGVAAHWLYKEGSSNDVKNKSKWLHQLTSSTVLAVEAQNPNSFEQNAVRLFQDRVFVFTPTDEVKDLPKGATALDFAYSVHSQIGHTCKAAKINGDIAGIKTILQNGDRVEIITQKNSSPSKEWLKRENGFLVTSKARSKVANWFRMHDQKTTDKGSVMLSKFAKSHKLIIADVLPSVLAKMHLSSDVFYYKIAIGEIKMLNVFKNYLSKPHVSNVEKSTGVTALASNIFSEVLIEGMSEVKTVIAACCFPLPDEEIIGYISSGRGIVIHRVACKNIKNASADKIIPVQWSNYKNSYEARLYCSCYEFLLANEALQQLLVKEKIRLTHLNVLNKNSEFTDNVIFEFRILVKSVQELEVFIIRLRARKSIVNVWR